MRKLSGIVSAALFLAGLAIAQAATQGGAADQNQAAPAGSRQVQQADLSIPFGTVTGRLITTGDYMVFVDDQRPESTFVIPRSDVQDLKFSDGTMSVTLRKPVRDRTGERSNLSFRLVDPAGSEAIASWLRSPAGTAAPAANASNPAPAANASTATSAQGTAEAQPSVMRYQVKHDHHFGSCTGNLIITPTQLIYESVTDIGDSRRWSYQDVKELKHDNPYDLKVYPFTGNDYHFEFIGTPLDSNEYRALVNHVTAARR